MPLPNTTNCPPGGWHYLVPETGKTITAPSWGDLRTFVRGHYQATGYITPADLDQKMDEWICKHIPGYCSEPGTASPPPSWWESAIATYHMVRQGTSTLVAWLASSPERVPQELAEKRAAVCAVCPLNTPIEGCVGCSVKALEMLVDRIVRGRATAVDSKLHACKVCLCHLRAKVHLPVGVLWRNMPEKQRAALHEKCWLRAEATVE